MSSDNLKERTIINQMLFALKRMLELADNQGLSQNHGAIIDATDAIELAETFIEEDV